MYSTGGGLGGNNGDTWGPSTASMLETLCLLPSVNNNTLQYNILGVYFDRRLTWGHMIDQLTIRCRQRLEALFRVREYLGQSVLVVAYKSFVRPVCEYGSVIFMGASAVHLHKLDAV